MRWFLLGILFVCAVALVAGLALIRQSRGFSTREQPTAMERWLAREARALAMPADAKSRMNPIPNTPEAIADGRAHWADHCFSCHANDGSGDTLLGKRLYPPAPDMRLPATQQLTEGELFYIIQNGIRLTGMPAWGSGSAHDEEDSWKLVHFIRHLPQIGLEEKKAMEKMNPKSPDDLREEQEEERFLRGEDNNEPSAEHHHH
ncbi:MAG: cytochrome c [Acidobacteriia bacterium]|nr:cytochrome c [Terriglobia bacterium]